MGANAGGGFLPVGNQAQQQWGPTTPAKGHPMTASVGNTLHRLPALIKAVASC